MDGQKPSILSLWKEKAHLLEQVQQTAIFWETFFLRLLFVNVVDAWEILLVLHDRKVNNHVFLV